MADKPASTQKRTVLAFANINEFYNTLQDRLFVALRRFGFVSQKHTSWITALPRDEKQEIETMISPDLAEADRKKLAKEGSVPILIYAGIDKQRKLLEGNNLEATLDQHWFFLRDETRRVSNLSISSKLLYDLISGVLDLENLPSRMIGNLEEYFKPVQSPEPLEEHLQRRKSEYYILKHHFPDLAHYWYISVPLIGFGEIDGIVHIVLHEDDLNKYKRENKIKWSTRMIGDVIRLFSWEYEALIMDWEIVGVNKYETSLIPYVIAEVNRKDFLKSIESKSPILKELEYKQMYEDNTWYYLQRFLQNFEVTKAIYDQQLKNAITAILVDSYAHNVSAHSLTALSWWFRKRSEWRSTSGKTAIKGFTKEDIEQLDRFSKMALTDLKGDYILTMQQKVKQIAEELEAIYFPSTNDSTLDSRDNSIITFKGSLAREIQPLIHFLAEKGAFWSGVTRDYNFGGEVRDLFSVLWYDFINNPLYLGTIAKTEDITHIRLKVVVYNPDVERLENGVVRKKILEAGEFASLNILQTPKPIDEHNMDGPNKIYYVDLPDGNQLHYAEHLAGERNYMELQERSRFVNPGKDYVALQKVLRQYPVFFPGGVVGRHAFYTIIENEIRNIKHYHGEALTEAQKNGLILTISIHPCSLREEVPSENELYKIGVWLEIPTKLKQQIRGDESAYLLQRKQVNLRKSVMSPGGDYAPLLGGNNQDKVCAAMLFNNVFSSVQKGDDDPRRLGFITGEGLANLEGEVLKKGDEGGTIKLPKDSDRDKRFYPWISSATSLYSAPHDDYEVSGKLPEKEIEFEDMYPHMGEEATGFIKKFFHFWKGSDIREITGDQSDWEWENTSRFKIAQVNVKEDYQKTWTSVRKAGVIRIVTSDEAVPKYGKEKFLTGYWRWLHLWIGNTSQSFLFDEESEGHSTRAFGLHYDGRRKEAIVSFEKTEKEGIDQQKTFLLAHRNTSKKIEAFSFRSHGVYRQYFGNADIATNSLEYQIRMTELLEICATKICIFDNRVRHRVRDQPHYTSVLSQMNVLVSNEKVDEWNPKTEDWESDTEDWKKITAEWKIKKDAIRNCNFLVMHLTFIDSLLNNRYPGKRSQSQSRLGIFIEQELMPLVADEITGEVRQNFIFVVTTGRGRKDWWDHLVESTEYKRYTDFTVFRPIESIIAGIESSIGKEDDMELKYNLVKIMFGS